MVKYYYTAVATPLGEFIVAECDGALKGGWFVGQKHFPDMSAANGWCRHETAVLKAAAEQLQAYFAGQRQGFDLPLAPAGTAFQQQVWDTLCTVSPGSTTTYARIARSTGRDRAFQAVGAAVGRNPISVIIPCHRALGSNGSLTGYAGGLERKRWLLAHEGVRDDLFIS